MLPVEPITAPATTPVNLLRWRSFEKLNQMVDLPDCPECGSNDSVEIEDKRGRFTWKKWGHKFRAPFLSQLNGFTCTSCNNYFKEH